jgi:oligoendopeptidase F
MPTLATPASRSFVPSGFNGADWQSVRPLIDSLASRPVETPADLEAWIFDRSDLDAACAEARADLYIASTCNTDDASIAAAYTAYLETVAPKLEVASFDLDKRQVALMERIPLDEARYLVLRRDKAAAVALFREANVPIQTELAKLGQEFGKITGAQTVSFDGQERTLPQMSRYLESTDRSVRESAWRGIASRRLQDREALDALLDTMVARRDAMSRNAGCASFVEYTFKAKRRFDYTPAHCRSFWDAAARHVVPFMRRLDQRRRAALGIDALRPWDLAVDPHGRPGLKPFTGGRELLRKTQAVMDGLDPRLGALTRRLGDADAPGLRGADAGALRTDFLDLDSRKGKRPGGYHYQRDFTRRPFIFMNAAGLHRDAMTMIHEAGHAFHSLLCTAEPIVDYRHSPIEFAEVASMSMEHLTMPHWGAPGAFYGDESDLRRARKDHLEDSVTILAWVATIDAFQHWMYENPGHTRAQRTEHWLGLDDRFGHAVSWDGLEDARAAAWQRQGHLYTHALYYIEYGIAQLGALGLWLKSRREGQKAAVDAYLKALSLGGSRPLPDLFAAAGLAFDFGDKTVATIVEAVEAEIESLKD